MMVRLQRLPVHQAHAHSMGMMTALAPGGVSRFTKDLCGITNRQQHSSTPKIASMRDTSGSAPVSCRAAGPHVPSTATSSRKACVGHRDSSVFLTKGAVVHAAPVVPVARLVTAEASATAAAEAPPRRRGFRPAPDLVACLRRFNTLHTATLQDFTDVQTQLHLGGNKVRHMLSTKSSGCTTERCLPTSLKLSSSKT